GGTGKTPIAAWLARQLGLRGHLIGVVLRGYGGAHSGPPRVVSARDEAAEVGDEALVHARRGPHVVVIGADRVAAARLAVERGAQVIVCDDGLQHLRLARDYEVAVVDAARGLGNGCLLPAGPLRERAGRLATVDAVVLTERDSGGLAAAPPVGPYLVHARFGLGEAVRLADGERRALATFAGRDVHAVAGVGHPGAFFAGLRAAGLAPVEHPLPDHAALEPGHLPFPAGATVLMTEKDAVKCPPNVLADAWWVDLEVSIDRTSAAQWPALILERIGLTGAGVPLG
ncbi:MAG TPA: tetraacyldisaccharide 4'-kinase, partial [Steroidobacteraceae bacterium]|nr:tetraacyldisaccharide 4'-kinase [Steroidobacteraceae bacterium]